MIIIIVVWVRKSYRRFPTTQIFPLELGALTIVSVNGGLIFFEEYAALPVDPAEGVGRVDGLLIIYSGVALMVGAMVSVALCKDLENLDTEAADGQKPELPTEPAAPRPSRTPKIWSPGRGGGLRPPRRGLRES